MDVGSSMSVEVAGSSVNAIINTCAGLEHNYVCNHIHVFYAKLSIERR